MEQAIIAVPGRGRTEGPPQRHARRSPDAVGDDRPRKNHRPPGDEPLESGAGTQRAACPMRGRQERRITGGAKACGPPGNERPQVRMVFDRSAERARLAHHRQRRRGRHDRAPLLAARGGRSTGIAGGSTGRCATGRGHRRGHHRRCATAAAATGTAARRAKLHERGAAAAAARAAETTGASGGCHKAAEDECQTDGTRHDYKTPPLPRPDGRDDVMRRPRRR